MHPFFMVRILLYLRKLIQESLSGFKAPNISKNIDI